MVWNISIGHLGWMDGCAPSYESLTCCPERHYLPAQMSATRPGAPVEALHPTLAILLPIPYFSNKNKAFVLIRGESTTLPLSLVF